MTVLVARVAVEQECGVRGDILPTSLHLSGVLSLESARQSKV